MTNQIVRKGMRNLYLNQLQMEKNDSLFVFIMYDFMITITRFSRMMYKSTIVQYYCLFNYLSKQLCWQRRSVDQIIYFMICETTGKERFVIYRMKKYLEKLVK